LVFIYYCLYEEHFLLPIFLSKNTFQYPYFVTTYFPFQEIDGQFVRTYENIHGAPLHPITIKSYLQLPFNTFSALLSLEKCSAYIPPYQDHNDLSSPSHEVTPLSFNKNL